MVIPNPQILCNRSLPPEGGGRKNLQKQLRGFFTPPLPGGGLDSYDSVTLTVSDAQLTEGDSGTVTAVYTVTLSSAHSQIVRVNYSTGDGTAITGNDYTMTSGMLEFAIGETSKTISVPVLADNLDENSETFHATLNSPANATIIQAQATATIIRFFCGCALSTRLLYDLFHSGSGRPARLSGTRSGSLVTQFCHGVAHSLCDCLGKSW